MGWFKKRGVDVIDLTDMEKKGLLQRQRGANDGDVVDLVPSGSSNISSKGGGVPTLGFLDNLAGASSSGESSSVGESLRNARGSALGQVNQLKIKLEDMEYKMEKLVERLSELESRIR